MAQQNVGFRQTALVSPVVNEGGTVTFKLRAPLAKTVTVRGDWEANGGVGQMNKESDGTWSFTTGKLPSDLYMYAFLVDSVRTLDPAKLISGINVEATLFSGNDTEIIRKIEKVRMKAQAKEGHLTTNDYVRDIVSHPAFQNFGELLLPWDDNTRYYDTRLQDVGVLMPYHSHVNPDVVVGALNRLIDDVDTKRPVFYDFYTEQQKQTDRTKNKTGLFFYRGKPGAPFAIICPGGGPN